MINNLSDSEIRKLRQLLRSVPCNGITTYVPGAGDLTINGGINGYTWTNTNNQVGPFTFTVIKTRNGA